MNARRLGKTGCSVSEVALGTWQVGGRWGEAFDQHNAERVLETAIENGITFIDTADVYSDGLSEEAVGRVVRRRSERVFVATKCGRAIQPHRSEGYTVDALRRFVEASLARTGLDRLDLIQLHCPPTQVYYRPEIFELFDRLKDEGKIGALGVSVEKVEEGLKAIEFDNVTTVQLIFNIFRHRPAERLFPEAIRRDVGVIVRVPLASGLLTGAIGRDTTFGPEDHRTFNRHGERFDRRETFSGVDLEPALDAVDELRSILGTTVPMARQALRWVLDHAAVATVIPGASRPEQVTANVAASGLDPLSADVHRAIRALYDARIRSRVHQRW